ncbi:unnamed protein product, partial [Staurois parvus]
VGTGGWHWWAQVGGHRWVELLGTCRWHFWAQVGALLGTGGCTAGHGWAELVGALLGGTCGGTAGHRSSGHGSSVALMIGADPPALTTAGSRQYFPHDLTA